MKIEIELEPAALSRPRINTTNRGRYLPAKSQAFKEQLQWLLPKLPKLLKEPLKVELHYYRPLKETAQSYGDIDNLTKAVLDACNGIIWCDDRQIVELHCYKHKGDGKIEMEVMECT